MRAAQTGPSCASKYNSKTSEKNKKDLDQGQCRCGAPSHLGNGFCFVSQSKYKPFFPDFRKISRDHSRIPSS